MRKMSSRDKGYALFLSLVLGLFSGCRDRSNEGGLQAEKETCVHPWAFFDLGDTLVDTKTYDFKKVLYMPKAHAYITELHSKNYKMGMLINVPETWGDTAEEKFAFLKKFLANVWIENDPFPWDWFEYIFLPPSDTRRKPDPFLFKQAVAASNEFNCAAVYQGEVEAEMQVAKAEGLFPYRVGQTEDFFMPESELKDVRLGSF